MGQGGAMAIEDAVSIAMLLPYGTKAIDIPARLELYQSSRRPRVEMILNFTRMNGRDNERISRMISFSGRYVEFSDTLLAAEMVKFMGICVSYNEIENCKKLLEAL
jgi:salicylate hydroxylase